MVLGGRVASSCSHICGGPFVLESVHVLRRRRVCRDVTSSASRSVAVRTDVDVPLLLKRTRAFVVLADLHVRAESLDTCLQVLRETHRIAAQRDAGVLFCGDFWHYRGAIPVSVLHHVLTEIAQWTCPVILIPGNHDMYSRHAQEQALTPIATTLGRDRALLVTEPAVFMDALFLPYTPRVDHFCRALQSAARMSCPPSTVFCHAEIAGAKLAHSLVSPASPDIAVVQPAHFSRFGNWERVYSGHLHRPHTIPNTFITYVGSPYQVTAAEAGQQKSLLVLDAHDRWSVAETLPIDIGPRHHHFRLDHVHFENTAQQYIQACRPGDRVILYAPKHFMGTERLLSFVASVRTSGARVRVQQVHLKSQLDNPSIDATGSHDKNLRDVAAPASPTPRLRDGSEMAPLAVFEKYAATKELPHNVVEMGREVVRNQAAISANHNRDSSGHLLPMHLKWLSCDFSGFGSFLQRVHYSLNERGVVMITGRDEALEDNINRSNGAGKSTLCLASLWALTGYFGGRPATLEVVNDDTDIAEVTTTILVSGERVDVFARNHGLEFAENGTGRLLVVKRTSKRRDGRSYKQTLEFSLDGKDLTCLDIRLTQRMLEDLLQPAILSYTTFFNESMSGILNLTDSELKRLLSLLFPTDMWADSRATAQRKAAEYSEKACRAQSAAEASNALVNQLNESVKCAQVQVRKFEMDRDSRLNKIAQQSRSIEATLTSVRSELVQVESAITACSPSDRQRLRDAIQECELQIRDKLQALSQLDVQRKNWEDARQILEQKRSDLVEIVADARGCEVVPEAVVRELESACVLIERLQNAQPDNDSESGEAKVLPVLSGDPPVDLNDAVDRVCEVLDELESSRFLEDIHCKYLTTRLETSSHAEGACPMVCERCLSPFNEVTHRQARGVLQKQISEASGKVDLLQRGVSVVRRGYLSLKALTNNGNSNAHQVLDDSADAKLKNWIDLSDYLQSEEEILVNCRKKLEKMKGDLRALNDAWESAEEMKEKSRKLRDEIRELEFAQSEVRHRMNEAKHERNPHLSSVSALEAEAESSGRQAQVMEEEAESLQTHADAARMLDVALGPRGVQSFILEAGLSQLEARTDCYLHALSGGELFARFQGYSEYKTPKRGNGDVSEVITKAVYVKRKDGQFTCRGLRQLSSGQLRRVDLACSLAFADLCREHGHHSSSMLVVDEGLRYLDAEGRRCFAKVLTKLPYETILVVSHEEMAEIAAVSDGGVDVCVRNNDCSHVIVNGQFPPGEAIQNDSHVEV